MRIAHSPTLVRFQFAGSPGVQSSNVLALLLARSSRHRPSSWPCGLAKRVRRTTRRRRIWSYRTRTSPTIVTPLVLESPRRTCRR